MSNPVSEIERRFARRIVEVRKERGLTQSQLGDKCGLHASQMQRIESRTNRVSLAEALILTAALQVSLGELIGQRPLILTRHYEIVEIA